MTNVDIIKQYLLPLIVPKEENVYTKVFLSAWKTSFVSAVLKLQSLGKRPIKFLISRELLENMSFEQALNKYENVINEWLPEKTLDVFWIKCILLINILY